MLRFLYFTAVAVWIWETPPRQRPGRPVLVFFAWAVWISLLAMSASILLLELLIYIGSSAIKILIK